MTPTGRRFRGEAGFAGGGEVLPFGVLTFVVGTLLVANAWAVVDAKLAASTAAREAVRAYVESPDPTTADAAARQAATAALGGLGRDPSRLDLVISAPAGFARCARVVVEVTYAVPTVSLPWIGGFGGPLTVHDRHSELVDPYRDGLAPGGGCG